MKTQINALVKAFMISLCGFLLLSGCKKQETAEADLVDNTDLTTCQTDANCSFLFANNVGMNERMLTFAKGQYRIFWAQTRYSSSSQTLFMMAPMIGDRFILKKEDILAGRVKYDYGCTTCNFVAVYPIDGEVKGQRVKQAEGLPEKWLIDATLILGNVNTSIANYTVHIKQYYTPAVNN